MAPASIDRELDAPLPGCCPHCGGDVVHERDAEQFQTDLPARPAPVVTRFTVGVGRCRSCGKRVQGRNREQTSDALGAAGSQIGPVAKGWVAWLHYGFDQACDALDAREADPAERTAVAGHVVEMIELLYGERQAIVTFLDHPGVEATNWRGEQAIRPAVVNRKVWGGNRTWRGASTQGTIMSVLRTATQQGVDVVDYLGR